MKNLSCDTNAVAERLYIYIYVFSDVYVFCLFASDHK
jgi:hypothetical protein